LGNSGKLPDSSVCESAWQEGAFGGETPGRRFTLPPWQNDLHISSCVEQL